MPDPFDDVQPIIRKELDEYILTDAPSQVDEETLWNVCVNSNAARDIHLRVQDMGDEAVRVSYANHVIRDAAKRAMEGVRSTGTKFVHALFRREADTANLFGIDAYGPIYKAGLYRLSGQSSEIPLRYLSLRDAARDRELKIEQQTADNDLQLAGIAKALELIRDRGDVRLGEAACREFYESMRGDL